MKYILVAVLLVFVLVSCETKESNLFKDPYIRAVKLYSSGQYKECIQLADSVIKKSNNEKYTAGAYYLKGRAYQVQKLFSDSVFIHFQMAIMLFDQLGNDKYLSRVHNHKGELFFQHSLYRQALTSYSKARDHAEEIDNEIQLAATNYGMGKALRRLGLIEKAQEHLFVSLEYAIKQNNKKYWISTKVEMGNLFFDIEDFYLSINEYDEALKVVDNKSGFDKDIGKCLNNIGLSYFEIGDYDDAKNYLIQSLTYEGRDSVFIAGTYATLGEIYLIEENYSKSISSLKSSLSYNHGYIDVEILKKAKENIQALFIANNHPDSAMYYGSMIGDIHMEFDLKRNKWNVSAETSREALINAKNEFYQNIENDRKVIINSIQIVMVCLVIIFLTYFGLFYYRHSIMSSFQKTLISEIKSSKKEISGFLKSEINS